MSTQAPNQTPKQALIVAHGQPSEPEPPELRLATLASDVQARLTGWEVTSATIAMPNALEDAVAKLHPGALIYPMFMSDGWFVSKVLPRRLGDAPVTVLPPLGFDPDLPALAARVLTEELQRHRWGFQQTDIVLAAHGSGRGDRAAKAANTFAEALKPFIAKANLTVGFIEEAPFVKDAATGLRAQSLCQPFFALEGDHCRTDIPEALEAADFQGKLLRPLGEQDAVIDLIARALTR